MTYAGITKMPREESPKKTTIRETSSSMRELYLATTAIPTHLSAADATDALKNAINDDPSFRLLDCKTVEKPECTYTKLTTACALEGRRGEEYYQRKGLQWPTISFFVNTKAGSETPHVYARSDNTIDEDLCNQATNQAARVIDASNVSETKIHVVPNFKAIAGVGIGIVAFMLVMGFLSMW